MKLDKIVKNHCKICNSKRKLYIYRHDNKNNIESFICYECVKEKNDRYRKIINEVRK
jgi:hypothetical protein